MTARPVGERSSGRHTLLLIPAVVLLAFHARTLDYGFVWTDGVEPPPLAGYVR